MVNVGASPHRDCNSLPVVSRTNLSTAAAADPAISRFLERANGRISMSAAGSFESPTLISNEHNLANPLVLRRSGAAHRVAE